MIMDEQINEYDYSSVEMSGYSERNGIMGLCKSRKGSSTSRFQLEMDILVMQKQLQQEKELHAILENALERNSIESSSTLPLPTQAEELLSNISMLEVTVSKLQQEMVSLHFQISQERNERRLAEYHMRYSSPQDTVDSVANVSGNKASMDKDAKTYQPVEFWKLSKTMPPKSLWEHPNKLSEEMVRCMKNIFIYLADSASPNKFPSSVNNCPSISPRGHLSNSSLWSLSDRSKISPWAQKSPQLDFLCSSSEILATENACDPYSVRGKLSWADLGNYGSAIEVSWMSVDKKQQEYAAEALRRFRILVEQLAKVNPIHLGSDERLAFWINLYNALIMHAYLAYGVPRSDLKLFSLMQKAAYTVGGHSFTATVIEYAILKMKPPAHRPQIALLLALHKLKVSEEQRKLAIDTFEPLVAFALSTGMHSSPAVRIFTAKNVKEELEEAQRDYIRASVGVSNIGRLLVPKMLHCFARGFVDEPDLTQWISRHLPAHQASLVEQCVSQRRHRLLGSRNCGILSFDSRFRYLFLPEETQS